MEWVVIGLLAIAALIANLVGIANIGIAVIFMLLVGGSTVLMELYNKEK